jgi:hypothetical protein
MASLRRVIHRWPARDLQFPVIFTDPPSQRRKQMSKRLSEQLADLSAIAHAAIKAR